LLTTNNGHVEYPLKNMTNYLWTGQLKCYDINGNVVSCHNSGQDAEFLNGTPWPSQRFVVHADLVLDNLTGLQWLKNANYGEFPLNWQEALDYIVGMNKEQVGGRTDWRLPNRREFRSLLSLDTRKPALPAKHPFENVFLNWYWTSTTAAINPKYAWYVHMEGARMFFGRKDQYYLFWPICGKSKRGIPKTGQIKCYDSEGNEVSCAETNQDGDLQMGLIWPKPRFTLQKDIVLDRLTGLYWLKNANIYPKKMNWLEALNNVKKFARDMSKKHMQWRLPTINELESLVDCSQHGPALPSDHPFENVRDVYWSSTTSFFEPDWAWALYFNKGATGVGFKQNKDFHLWPVASKPGE
jgi:hypothetical protein